MIEDAELLRRYVEDHAEGCFTELVNRHIGLVYACALRHVGHDRHLAEDVTQRTFSALARKAPSLLGRPSLGGWLYVSAYHAAAETVRTERRRKARESAATSMETILHPTPEEPDAEWSRLRPLLDDLVLGLKDSDREAVVLRFFEKRPFAEVAAALGLNEDAARKRVDRAIEKLRASLAQRGVTSTSSALTFALAGQAGAAIPTALAAEIAGIAVAGATVGSGASLLATLMTALTSDVAAVVATLLIGAGLVAWQTHTNADLQAKLTGRAGQAAAIAALRQDNQRLARRVAEADDLRLAAATLPAPRAPVATSFRQEPIAPVTLRVTEKGSIQWEGEPVTLGDFIQRLTALRAANPNQEPQVIIRGAPGSRFDATDYVVEQVSRAGIKSIAVDSQAPPSPSNNWITVAAPLPTPGEIPPPAIPDAAAKP